MRAAKFITSSLLSVSMLWGCGADTHPVCRDEASTTEYGLQWQRDLAAARQAGKVTVEDVLSAQQRTLNKARLLKSRNWSGWCNQLDKVRKEKGF